MALYNHWSTFHAQEAADFERDLCSSERGRARRNFVFVRYKQRTILLLSRWPNFMTFAHTTWIGEAVNSAGREF